MEIMWTLLQEMLLSWLQKMKKMNADILHIMCHIVQYHSSKRNRQDKQCHQQIDYTFDTVHFNNMSLVCFGMFLCS